MQSTGPFGLEAAGCITVLQTHLFVKYDFRKNERSDFLYRDQFSNPNTGKYMHYIEV